MHFKYSRRINQNEIPRRIWNENVFYDYRVVKQYHETQWSKAKLTLIENDNQLTVTVADNGNGFKTNDETAIEGFGLHQIRARISRLNGQVIVKSSPKRDNYNYNPY
jgi:signal transduction histidine kinase